MKKETTVELLSDLNRLEGCLQDAARYASRIRKTIEDGDAGNAVFLQLDSDAVGLSARALNVMRSLGLKTVGDLLDYGVGNLLNNRNCGQRTMQEVKEALARLSLC